MPIHIPICVDKTQSKYIDTQSQKYSQLARIPIPIPIISISVFCVQMRVSESPNPQIPDIIVHIVYILYILWTWIFPLSRPPQKKNTHTQLSSDPFPYILTNQKFQYSLLLCPPHNGHKRYIFISTYRT